MRLAGRRRRRSSPIEDRGPARRARRGAQPAAAFDQLDRDTHSWFYSPLACAVVGRPHASIARLRARMGGAHWDSIVAAYTASISARWPNFFANATAEIMALHGPAPHVDEETQNRLFRLRSRLHEDVDYSPNPDTGLEDFACGEFIYENYGSRDAL